MTDTLPEDPRWLVLARELQALAQTGLAYAQNPYDADRYKRIHELAMTLAAAGFAVEPVVLGGLFASTKGYATPQVDVRGAVFRDDRVLLVQEATDCKWSLPGGWADIHSSPCENVEREIKEESGLSVKTACLVAIYDRRLHPYRPPNPRHVYKLYFNCKLVSGTPSAGDDTLAADFFPVTALPELSQGRVLGAHILRCYERHLNPDLPTLFD